MNHAQFWGGGGAAPYEIEQSLRFESGDTHYLNRTPGSAGNRRTWTFSCWFKRPKVTESIFFISGGFSGGGATQSDFRIRLRSDSDSIEVANAVNNSNTFTVHGSPRFRDPSAWYHLVVAMDTTQSTASDRVKIWVNGEQITAFATSNYPSLNEEPLLNTALVHRIGAWDDSGSVYSPTSPYLAEMYHVDGTALDHEDFGEYDTNGVWRPIRPTISSYGTTGFYLDFSNSSNLGEDQAGSNDWTANNFTTSGTGTDVMSDTPTTNYPTGNPLASNNPSSVSEGNLKFVGDTANIAANGMHTTMGMSSGKWYFEVDINVGGGARTVGILPADAFAKSGKTTTTNYDTYYNDGALSYSGFSQKIEGHGTSVTINTYGDTWTTNDVIGVAFDADNGKLFFAKNNTWQESGDPAAGTNAAFTGVSGTYVAHAGGAQGFTATFNFGQRAFAYTPPTGFKALNTSNLPAPTVKDGSDYFGTVLYSGDGGTSNTVTGLSFTPDVVWGKSRSNALPHNIFDVVRGFDKQLDVNDYVAEVDRAGDAVTPLSNGFTLDATYCNINNSSTTNVAWCWDAGGSGSTNTAGSITSTVSANPSAGFSIVSYTGTNSSATVGHGLGVELAMYIVKDRDNGNNWAVYHKDLGNTTCLFLDTTAAQATASSTYWNNTSPTSTTFSIGNNARTGAARDYVAYCFAEVENYSRIGSYVGNGSSDGPFVYCGFKPAWLLLKRTDSTSAWFMLDTTRDAYNVSDSYLVADDSIAEGTYTSVDFLSNGFKARNPSSSFNTSGATHVFVAFAENPFGGSGVSPATAR